MKEKKTFTIIALVLSIIALVLSGSGFSARIAALAIILSVIGLIKETAKKRAIVALLIAILAILIRILAIVLHSKNDETVAPSYEDNNKETVIETAKESYTEPSEDEALAANSVWASDFTPITDFRYTIDEDNKTITLIRYSGKDTKIMLSPVYYLDDDYYKLVSMGDDACFLSETYITSVFIPDTVTFIGGSCFNSCSSLTDIRLPKSATDIGNTFLSYLHDYDVVYEDIDSPTEYDKRIYSKTPDDTSNSAELGEGFARAINGMLGGVNEDPNTKKVVTIHYNGTQEQWNTLFPNTNSVVSSDEGDLTEKGKEAGDKLAKDLANVDW